MSDTLSNDESQQPPILTEIPLKLEGTEVVSKLVLEQTIPDCYGGNADILMYSVCNGKGTPLEKTTDVRFDRRSANRPLWRYVQGVIMARTRDGKLIKMSANDVKAFSGLFNGGTRVIGKPRDYDKNNLAPEFPEEAIKYLDDLAANPDKNVTPITYTFTD